MFLFAYKTGSAMTFRRTSCTELCAIVTICYSTEGAVTVVPTYTHESHALTILAIGHAHMPSLGRTRTRNFDDDMRGAGGIQSVVHTTDERNVQETANSSESGSPPACSSSTERQEILRGRLQDDRPRFSVGANAVAGCF